MRCFALVLLVAVLLVAGVVGCASTASIPKAHPGSAEVDSTVSLFPSDSEILSDEAIARILDAPPRLPPQVRIALLHIQHQSATRFWGWGPYWTALAPSAQQELAATMVASLRRSARVEDASYLPGFLLPEKPSVGHLREAAARFQADAIFVYQTDCQAYERYRLFQANQVKAFCSAESALLDVRSGIVPFTSRSIRDFTVEEARSDANFLETVRHAETRAFTAALEENAGNLVAFLDATR